MWTDGVLSPDPKLYDPEVTTCPLVFSAGVSVLLAALQTPCCVRSLSQKRDQVIGEIVKNESYYPVPQNLPITYNHAKTLYSESHSKASYEHYRMSSDLITDTGWRAFPLGKQCASGSSQSGQDTVAFSHMHCPVQIRKVTIEAMRINAWPEIIEPVHWQDEKVNPPIKHILKHYTIEPLPVQLSADGCDTIHEVVATYWYYLNRPYEIGSQHKMPVGRLPYVSKARLATDITHKSGVDLHVERVSGNGCEPVQDVLQGVGLARADVVGLARFSVFQQGKVGIADHAHVVEFSLDVQVAQFNSRGFSGKVVHQFRDEELTTLPRPGVVERP
jgi:hypothetical protein